MTRTQGLQLATLVGFYFFVQGWVIWGIFAGVAKGLAVGLVAFYLIRYLRRGWDDQ